MLKRGPDARSRVGEGLIVALPPEGGQVTVVVDIFGVPRTGVTSNQAENDGYGSNAEYSLSMIATSKTCTDS